MRTGFRDSDRNHWLQVFLETRRLGFSALLVGEKNDMRNLWTAAFQFLRSKDQKSSGSVLRRYEDLSGLGNSSSVLPQVPESEAGAVRMAGGVSFLYQALCFLCGPQMSGVLDNGYCQRTAFGLEDSQIFGKAVYAGAVAAEWDARSEGDQP